jgi:ligand-binding sensor domain-containing protein
VPHVLAFAVSGTKLFAGFNNRGVYLTSNNGTNWTAVNNGLTHQYVYTLAVLDTNLFAGTQGGGVFLTTNNGTNWNAVNNGLTNQYVYSLAVMGTKLFAGTSIGIYLSTNNGTSWTSVNNGLNGESVIALSVSGSNIFAGTGGGIYSSTNSGTSWFNKNQGISVVPTTRALLITNNYIFTGIDENSVWRRSYSEIIGIETLSTEIPSSFSLSQNYPNPFNPATNLEFEIPDPGFVSLKIYDLLGKEVVTLVNEKLNPGTYRFEFEADNLTSGVYFYRLTSGDFADTKRMMLIK